MINAQLDDKVVRIGIDGPLTIYQVIEYKPQLLDAISSACGVELDLAAVDEIDGAGLQLLLFARREVIASGDTWRVVAHSEVCREVLMLAGLMAEFDVVDVVESEGAP